MRRRQSLPRAFPHRWHRAARAFFCRSFPRQTKSPRRLISDTFCLCCRLPVSMSGDHHPKLTPWRVLSARALGSLHVSQVILYTKRTEETVGSNCPFTLPLRGHAEELAPDIHLTDYRPPWLCLAANSAQMSSQVLTFFTPSVEPALAEDPKWPLSASLDPCTARNVPDGAVSLHDVSQGYRGDEEDD